MATTEDRAIKGVDTGGWGRGSGLINGLKPSSEGREARLDRCPSAGVSWPPLEHTFGYPPARGR